MIFINFLFILVSCYKNSNLIKKNKIQRSEITVGGFSNPLWNRFDELDQNFAYKELLRIVKKVNIQNWESEKKDLIRIPIQLDHNFFHILAMIEDSEKFNEIFLQIFNDDRKITEDIAHSLNIYKENIIQLALFYNINSALSIWNKSTEKAKSAYNIENIEGNNLIFDLAESFFYSYIKNNKKVNREIYITLFKEMIDSGIKKDHKNKKDQNVVKYVEEQVEDVREADINIAKEALDELIRIFEIDLK